MSELSFTRQLGIGDLQHVRTLLLSVGFFNPQNIAEQVRGAAYAADRVGMMMRAHINGDMLSIQDAKSLQKFTYENVQHQYMIWYGLDEEEFSEKFSTLDIIIEGDLPDDPIIPITISQGILKCWEDNNRRMLGGNFANRSREQLKETHGHYLYEHGEYWQKWSNNV